MCVCVCVCVCVRETGIKLRNQMNGCMRERERGHQVESFVFVVALKKADLYVLFFFLCRFLSAV